MTTNTFNNIEEYLMRANRLFGKRHKPTTRQLKALLVPTGAHQDPDKREGSFGPGGVYKYTFTLGDGFEVTIKWHRRHRHAADRWPDSNSGRYATAQIYYVDPKSGKRYQLYWDTHSNQLCSFTYTAWRTTSAFVKNWSHIPVVWKQF